MRRYFITGLVIWIPFLAVYFVIRFFVELLDHSIALLPQSYQPEALFGYDIPGLGVLLTLIIVFLTGMLTTNFIGRHLVRWWEHLLARIPLVRSIHRAVKQMLEAFVHTQSDSFRRVVLVQYPRKGVWSIGFQTSATSLTDEVGQALISVFIPTTPNPTSGFMILVPPSETQTLSITVEEAFRMIVSLGVAAPAHAKQSDCSSSSEC